MAWQGPNESFKTAQVACKTTQTVSEIKTAFKALCGQYQSKGKEKEEKTFPTLKRSRNKYCYSMINPLRSAA